MTFQEFEPTLDVRYTYKTQEEKLLLSFIGQNQNYDFILSLNDACKLRDILNKHYPTEDYPVI